MVVGQGEGTAGGLLDFRPRTPLGGQWRDVRGPVRATSTVERSDLRRVCVLIVRCCPNRKFEHRAWSGDSPPGPPHLLHGLWASGASLVTLLATPPATSIVRRSSEIRLERDPHQ